MRDQASEIRAGQSLESVALERYLRNEMELPEGNL